MKIIQNRGEGKKGREQGKKTEKGRGRGEKNKKKGGGGGGATKKKHDYSTWKENSRGKSRSHRATRHRAHDARHERQRVAVTISSKAYPALIALTPEYPQAIVLRRGTT